MAKPLSKLSSIISQTGPISDVFVLRKGDKIPRHVSPGLQGVEIALEALGLDSSWIVTSYPELGYTVLKPPTVPGLRTLSQTGISGVRLQHEAK